MHLRIFVTVTALISCFFSVGEALSSPRVEPTFSEKHKAASKLVTLDINQNSMRLHYQRKLEEIAYKLHKVDVKTKKWDEVSEKTLDRFLPMAHGSHIAIYLNRLSFNDIQNILSCKMNPSFQKYSQMTEDDQEGIAILGLLNLALMQELNLNSE